MKTLLTFLVFVSIGWIIGDFIRDIYKSHDSHKVQPVTPSTPKHYTIELAGQVFHTTDYTIDSMTNSVQFRDSTGQNVVLYDAQHVTITEDK